MNPTILPQAMGELLGRVGFFNLGNMANGLEEEKV